MEDINQKENLQTTIVVGATLALVLLIIIFPYLKFGLHPNSDRENHNLEGDVREMIAKTYHSYNTESQSWDITSKSDLEHLKFDSLGNKTYSHTILLNAEKVYELEFKCKNVYDTLTRLCHTQSTYSDGRINYHKYELNDSLRIRKTHLLSRPDSMIIERRYSKWDLLLQSCIIVNKTDTVSKATHKYNEFDQDTLTTYYDKGKLQRTAKTEYKSDSSIVITNTFFYDDDSPIIIEEEVNYRKKDKHGNWLEQEKIINGEKHTLTLYEYKYFEKKEKK